MTYLQSCYPPGRVLVKVAVMLFVWLFGMEITTTWDRAWAGNVELLTPRQGSTITARNPETHLVMRQSDNVKKCRVKVEKSGEILEPEVEMEGEEHIYLHFRLPLGSGLNIFTIVPGGQRLEITYQPIKTRLPSNLKSYYLFHQNDQLPKSCVDCHDLQATDTMAPVGIKQQTSCTTCHANIVDKNTWQHNPVVNQQCLTCHQQSVKPWRIGFREGGIEDTCIACHTSIKNWRTRKHRHAAMIGGCTLCHDPHTGKFRYLLWAEGNVDLCVSCHTDKQKLFSKDHPLSYVHGIITGAGCIICHDPHGADNLFVLRKPINELCLGCHPVLLRNTLGHPVANHPVGGVKDPLRPDREFVCSSCHEPHGTNHQHMLIQTKRGGLLCRVCHKR